MLQIGILYVLSVCLLCKNFSILRSSLCFYTMVFGIFFLLIVPLLYVLLDRNPIIWILFYISGERHRVSFIYVLMIFIIRNKYSNISNVCIITINISKLNVYVLFSDYIDDILDNLFIILYICYNASNAIWHSSYNLHQKILSCPSRSRLYPWTFV